MNKFDEKSIRLLIVVVVICITFVAFLPMAYRNIPKQNTENIQQLASNGESADAESIPQADENNVAPASDNKKHYINFVEDESDNVISENNSNEISQQIGNTETDEKVDDEDNDIFQKAATLRNNEKYESAVYEYQQIIDKSDDIELKAKCYQEIALTYASIKRYGSALSNAQKAYNMSPNTEKELLLARLYYKTGNINKATEHINAILKRDFIESK